MTSKKRMIMFAFQFPVTLLLGILFTFAYSMRAHEEPSIDWLVAVLLAIALDIVLTLWNMRDEKKHRVAS